MRQIDERSSMYRGTYRVVGERDGRWEQLAADMDYITAKLVARVVGGKTYPLCGVTGIEPTVCPECGEAFKPGGLDEHEYYVHAGKWSGWWMDAEHDTAELRDAVATEKELDTF